MEKSFPVSEALNLQLANKATYFNQLFYGIWTLNDPASLDRNYTTVFLNKAANSDRSSKPVFLPQFTRCPWNTWPGRLQYFQLLNLEPKKIHKRILFESPFWGCFSKWLREVQDQRSPTVLAKLESYIQSNCYPIKKINKNIQPGPPFQVFTFLHELIFPLWCCTEQFDILLLLGLEIHSLYYGLKEKKWKKRFVSSLDSKANKSLPVLA